MKRLGLVAGNGGNDGWGGNGPLSGARVGDRFALALISLALDEVDAMELLGGVADRGTLLGDGGEPGVSAETPMPSTKEAFVVRGPPRTSPPSASSPE